MNFVLVFKNWEKKIDHDDVKRLKEKKEDAKQITKIQYHYAVSNDDDDDVVQLS